MFAALEPSGSASADELKWFSRRRRPSVAERSQDRIEHRVQFPADIFSKKTQHQVTVLLQQLIFPAIATVRNRVREMLRAVQLHGHP